MKKNDLKLRSVNDLLNEVFFIPAYQRGYRWAARQVTDLLNDVFSFMNKDHRNKEEFYCLQPVVVAEHAGQWELIDGQQRLTTLFLILSYFNNRLAEKHRKTLFTLTYETRENSAYYLQQPDEERSLLNIDFFHIWNAYRAIETWFSDKQNLVNDVESAFLNKVKIIWYEVPGDVNPIEVFTRLNMGKIPLTNAELVKALFLRAGNFESEGPMARDLRQLKIAQEWDEIERRLQDDAFWFFLANATQESNRIDFILKLCADEAEGVSIQPTDANYLFLAFNERLNRMSGQIPQEWDSVKRVFLLLDEWFRDRYLYHVVGFLLAMGAKVSHVRTLARSAASKTVFRSKLADEIFLNLFKQSCANRSPVELRKLIEDALINLEYGHATIPRLLLLFNIASLLENGDGGSRFPFDSFKKDKWDLEHIRSVKSDMPKRPDDQKAWLGHMLEYLSQAEIDGIGRQLDMQDSSIRTRLLSLRDSEPFDSAAFEDLFDAVLDLYDPGSDLDTDNSIGNLTLLDSATNRGYGNAIFPHKRAKLIALDRIGKFVPLCTKNVFLKYYSPRIDKMLIWTFDDAAAHQAAMVDTLARFFTIEGSNP